MAPTRGRPSEWTGLRPRFPAAGKPPGLPGSSHAPRRSSAGGHLVGGGAAPLPRPPPPAPTAAPCGTGRGRASPRRRPVSIALLAAHRGRHGRACAGRGTHHGLMGGGPRVDCSIASGRGGTFRRLMAGWGRGGGRKENGSAASSSQAGGTGRGEGGRRTAGRDTVAPPNAVAAQARTRRAGGPDHPLPHFPGDESRGEASRPAPPAPPAAPGSLPWCRRGTAGGGARCGGSCSPQMLGAARAPAAGREAARARVGRKRLATSRPPCPEEEAVAMVGALRDNAPRPTPPAPTAPRLLGPGGGAAQSEGNPSVDRRRSRWRPATGGVRSGQRGGIISSGGCCGESWGLREPWGEAAGEGRGGGRKGWGLRGRESEGSEESWGKRGTAWRVHGCGYGAVTALGLEDGGEAPGGRADEGGRAEELARRKCGACRSLSFFFFSLPCGFFTTYFGAISVRLC